MQEADKAFSSLNADENKACLDFHNEGGSLNHCIRWGLRAAEEIHAASAKVSPSLEVIDADVQTAFKLAHKRELTAVLDESMAFISQQRMKGATVASQTIGLYERLRDVRRVVEAGHY